MKKLTFEVDGKQIEVLAQKIAGHLWFHYQGRTLEYVPESAKNTAAGEQVLDPEKIVAPMPGKIIKIIKNQGDLVQEGETIVVMEAMKMEYNLKAIQDMMVAEIKCSENQTVSLGDILVELEEK